LNLNADEISNLMLRKKGQFLCSQLLALTLGNKDCKNIIGVKKKERYKSIRNTLILLSITRNTYKAYSIVLCALIVSTLTEFSHDRKLSLK
jgi:hypothetical protein